MPRKMNTIIGEKSIPLTGGISLLKGAKTGSVASYMNLNGCLYQSTLGNQLRSILARNKSQISWNNW